MTSEASSLPSIDKLMMTYVDLSLSNNTNNNRRERASFKGPPLKDLKAGWGAKCKKRDETTPQLPNTSQKSIDWKAFDGSALQNTFVIGNKESSGVNPDEEWGDFSASIDPPAAQPHQGIHASNTTKENEDDDFLDFISLRASTTITSPSAEVPSHSTTILPNISNLIEISSPFESQPSLNQGSDKYSVFKEFSSPFDYQPPTTESNGSSLNNEISSYSSSTTYSEAKRSSATDFFGLSPEPLSQPVCQSPIPLSTNDNSDSTFNILHLHSGSSPPEMAPTSDILGPSPLPDSLLPYTAKNLDSIHSDQSSSSSGNSQALKEDGISLSSNGSSSTTSHPSNFVLNPSCEDRYQAFREVIPSSREEENPLVKWLKLLGVCHRLLKSGASTFISIESDALLQDVLSSKKSSDYITNLIEVYRVSKRIQTSFRYVEEVDASVEMYGQIKEKLNLIDKAWCLFLEKVRSVAIEEEGLYSLLEQGNISCKRRDYCHCGICCSYISLQTNPSESTKWNNAFCKYGSRQYHSSCANLWLNCVESTLPDL